MTARRARAAAEILGAQQSIATQQTPPTYPVESKPIQQGKNRTYDLYFPAMLGPTRTRKRKGVKVRAREPELPPNANDRLHHHAKATWAKEWKTEAWAVARRRQLPRLERARISVVLYRTRLGVADPDGDWHRIKWILDGIVAAGVLPNDTYKHVTLGTIEEKRGPELGLLMILEEI